MNAARRQLQYKQLVDRLRKEIASLSKSNRQGGDGVKSVGALFYSELAIIVQATGDGADKVVDLALFHVATRRLLNRLTRPIDWSVRNKRAVAALVDELVSIDFVTAMGGVTAPAAGTVASVEESEGGSNWWLWAIVGAVVAGGVTAGVVLALPPDGPPPPTGGTLAVQF
jgi:phage tail tape-measure protein